MLVLVSEETRPSSINVFIAARLALTLAAVSAIAIV